jgi:hypothetical protein
MGQPRLFCQPNNSITHYAIDKYVFIVDTSPGCHDKVALIIVLHNEPIGSTAMADEDISTAEALRKTRTYGKFRCHNPSCMGRLEPEAGQVQVKCPECGMEFRVHWIRPDFPRIRGPVWDVNRKIAEEALKKKEKEQ